RRLRLSSPTSTLRNGDAARMPDMRRAVVPLFPQSSAADAAARPRRPTPVIAIVDENAGTGTPSARRTLAVDRTSAESRISRTTDLAPGRASAANIKARCEIDLSPGT